MISIIIPVFNVHEMTKECIHAIRENTQDYEIILVDNGSSPKYGIVIPGKDDFIDYNLGTLIRNETNLGFQLPLIRGSRHQRET